MIKFIYWSNKSKYHEDKLFECEATNIIEADLLCKDKTGHNPAKSSWISLTTVRNGKGFEQGPGVKD